MSLYALTNLTAKPQGRLDLIKYRVLFPIEFQFSGFPPEVVVTSDFGLLVSGRHRKKMLVPERFKDESLCVIGTASVVMANSKATSHPPLNK
jgi:hypothetical protein